MKKKLYLLPICILILSSLILVSCGKSAATSSTSTTSSNLTNTSSPVSAPTSNSSNTSGIAVIATLPVSNGAFRLAYDSSQGDIFVVNGANTLPESVISDNTNAVNAGASGEGANFVAYDSGKNELFETRNSYYTGWVISDTTGQATTMTVPEAGIYLPVALLMTQVQVISLLPTKVAMMW